jgi:class 3 adenylate cyclase
VKSKLQSNYIEYKLEDSVARIDEIISASVSSYEERDSVPSRDELTFINGFYVNCSALFVDIRKSSELTDFHKNRVLAKLYRTYISEVAAIMNGNPNCAEIDVVGDCVSGVLDTKTRLDVDRAFSTAFSISSIIDIMNYKFRKNNMTEITVGIGLAYGRALMIKGGYKGSGINEVTWMGDVVNEASKLAKYGNREDGDKEIMVSSTIYNYLSNENKALLTLNSRRNCYHGNVICIYMNNWYKQNCK